MRLNGFVLAAVLALGVASCRDSVEMGPGASGVEKSKAWSALTFEEKAAVCDWGAAKFGGYAMQMDCPDGSSIGSFPNQQACIDNLPADCGATVAQYEGCVNASNCASGIAPPACAPLIVCFQ